MEVGVSLSSSPTRSSWPCLGRSGTLRVKMNNLNLHILLDSGPRKKGPSVLVKDSSSSLLEDETEASTLQSSVYPSL